MKTFRPILYIILFSYGNVYAIDFLVKLTNERLLINPPTSNNDLNLIFDIEVCSQYKEGLFANVSSVGGNYIDSFMFSYQDGTNLKNFGKSYRAGPNLIENKVFMFVKGDQEEQNKYKKVATICTKIENEVTNFESLPDVSKIENFSGVIYALVRIFSVRSNVFTTHMLRINFEVKRLATGNMMELSMKQPSIKELDPHSGEEK